VYEIPVIPGDGVGPSVISATQGVLEEAGRTFGFDVEWSEYPFGADHYLETGEILPADAVSELATYDAILFGSVGDPRVEPGVLERGIVIRLRVALDQYVNLRPIKLFEGVEGPLREPEPDDIDLIVVRENTEDFYIGLGGRVAGSGTAQHQLQRSLYDLEVDVDIASDADEMAYGLGIASREGTERILRYGFERAQAAGHDRVTVVDKANVMPDLYGLWRDVARAVAAEYRPELEFRYADAAAMDLIRDPGHYDTIVAPNLFGDVLTDLGAMLQGGLGLCPGGNIAPDGTGLFEPMHGSAPDIAGEGIANPTASIWAGAMLLDHIGEERAGAGVYDALADTLAAGSPRTPDLGGSATTEEFAGSVCERL
jgi:tartrate dehydrogenase/decarboxylase/D-malate dehydrogenase